MGRQSRTILFLQGPPSVFWGELAGAFEGRGARVLRIRLSAADHLYWRRPGAVSYRGSLADWPRFLDDFLARESVDDIVLYADRLPCHVAAARLAERRGIGCHVIENGYLRPDWITLERGGMGVHSHFPDDPETIRAIARGRPEPDFEVRYRHAFAELAFHEVVHDLADRFGRLLHPGYDADKYYDPLVDFLSWLPRLFVAPRLERAAREVESWDPSVRFWLLAMQLQADYQIRANSHWRHLSDMLDAVLTSFAAYAAADERLVVKLHPHDNGYERWDRVVARLAAARGLGDRVRVVLGGDLGVLIVRSRGVVLVNSTVGIHALRAGKPLKVLGAAIYDVAGLTHPGPLDTFWTAPEAPDPTLVDAFVRALAATIQIKGDFYDPAGRRAAIEEIVERILSGRVGAPGGDVSPPPRLARFLAAASAPTSSAAPTSSVAAGGRPPP